MQIEKEHPDTALHVKRTKPVVIDIEKGRPAVRRIRPFTSTASCNCLLPPKDEFNTGYLKPRKYDLL